MKKVVISIVRSNYAACSSVQSEVFEVAVENCYGKEIILKFMQNPLKAPI